MTQNQLPSLVWGIKNTNGFSLRIVATDDLALAVTTIKEQLKSCEIVSDVWGIKSSADVSVMVVKDQSEEWFKKLDRDMTAISKIVDHAIILLMNENDYRKAFRFMSYSISSSHSYRIEKPKFTDLLIKEFGSLNGFCDFVEDNYK